METNIKISNRVRSQEYINRTKKLLELAESELISTDGHLISIKGLRKLQFKVDLFPTA